MSGILLQNGKQSFVDANGHPLAGGRVFFYAPNTSTPKDTWQNAAQTILNTNPIILDARGEASIYGSGSYRQVLKDAALVQIWDQFIPDLAGSLQDAITDLYSRAAIQVPNVAAVRALDKTVYKNAETLGYYTPGDDGTAKYYLDLADTTSVDNGGSVLVGADGGRWKFLTPFEGNIRQFGAKGDYPVTDDTVAIRKAVEWACSFGGYQTVVGAVNGGFISQVPKLGAPKGKYKLTDDIPCGSYFTLDGDNAFFIQTDPTKDILNGTAEAYQWDIRGINFVGGRHHAKMQNNNIDVTRWTYHRCTFSLSSDYAIKTFPTGGATSHLSANLSIKQCAFYKPRRVLSNYCDSAIVEDCWVFVSKDNFAASTPVFENGSVTCDGHPNLYLNNMFGVPSMGAGGARLATVRWVDMFKGALIARGSRFGGEDAGMPVVYWAAPPVLTYPYRGNSVSLVDCECFAGPSTAIDSGIISLQGQIPQRISIINCAGPIEVPYVINAGNQIPSIPAYFANYEAASGQKAYLQFRFNIMMNDSHAPDGTVAVARIPLGMRLYAQNMRVTKVSRVAAQAIATGSNIVNFDTLGYDSQGGWAAANADRLVIPMGASKMLIICNVILNGTFNGGVLDIQILNQIGGIVSRQNFLLSANADGPALMISAIVDGNPGDWFRINMRSTATTPGSIISAVANTQSLDYIG